MPGDFTRNTFRPADGFSLVRMQQGRVLTDADWNEQGDIARHLARTTRTDVIGASGFPEDDAGFGLVPLDGDLGILPGRGYVAGRMAEAAGETVRLERLSGSGADALYRLTDGPLLAEGQRLIPGGAAPEDALAVTEVAEDDDGIAVRLGGDLGAETATLTTLASLLHQPHLPGVVPPEDTGPYLAYLDLWDRQIFALEDPSLREVALGGPDTAGRDRTIWQVRLLPLQPLIDEGEVPAPPTCKSFPAGWTPQDGTPARMAARAEAPPAATGPCALPAAGGFRSFKNHLYRLEIHNSGVVGTDTVTVKFSTDNAMYRARLLEVADGALVVDDAGKDAATGFKTGDWLEVLDEQRILNARPGFFVQLSEVVGERLGVAEIRDPETLDPLTDGDRPDTDVLPQEGQVRRWEGGLPVAVEAGWMPLDEGIEIRFAEGDRARTGDYWTIPGRTVPADIEWPRDPSSDQPAELSPEGTHHAYAALAILDFDGTDWTVADDCRHLFPPLTGLETLHYLGGDGQQALPDLTQPDDFTEFPGGLTVGVTRGRTPVAGRLIRFTALVGDDSTEFGDNEGQVISHTDREIVLRTGENGLASVSLQVRPVRPVVFVRAELLDASQPDHADPAFPPIVFTAFLSTAATTAYDPSDCAFQSDRLIAPEPSRTVQEALDRLCPRPRFAIELGDGQHLRAETTAQVPLVVSLFWGAVPLAGHRVRFRVERGDASVAPEEAVVDDEGLATVRLTGGRDPQDDGGLVAIGATVIDPPPGLAPRQLGFHARFVTSDAVYVPDDICPDAGGAHPRDLDTILQHLCETGGGGGPVIRVERITRLRGGNPAPLIAYDTVPFTDLLDGLTVGTDRVIDAISVDGRPIGRVVMELPYPPPDSRAGNFYGVDDAQTQVPFRIDTALAGAWRFDEDSRTLEWRPDDSAARWLRVGARRMMGRMNQFEIEFIEARLELFANRIYDATGEAFLWMDGDLFLDRQESQGVRLPSGDGVRGGDLVLPFQLVA